MNTKTIVSKLDKIYGYTGQYTIFSDWIDLMLCALISDRTPEHPAEKEYMKIVERYNKSKEAMSLFADAFHEAMKLMKETNQEV